MEIKRLFDYIYDQLQTAPLEKSFSYKPNGHWVSFSTAEMVEKARKLSMGLIKLGIQPGDKIGLVTYKNRPEWVIADIAISQIGAINVPVYPTISSSEYEYIFNDAGVKAVFVGKDDLFEKVSTAQKSLQNLQHVFGFEKDGPAKHWEILFENTPELDTALQSRMDAVKGEELATLIYTSGTTGFPKGVMLSHQNIISNIDAVKALLPVQKGDRVLSFLPLCHIFERVATYAYTALNVSVYQTGTDNLGGDEGDLKAVQPHFFTTVPRLLEKVYEKIYNKGLDLTGVKKGLFFWALGLTEHYEHDWKPSGFNALKWKIADKLIFSKWREALGGNVKGIVTGAAACPLKMVKVFSAAGIPIREGYGLTESSPGIAVSYFEKGAALLGTIGPALFNVKIKIDDSDGLYGKGEGEVLAAGPNIMMGYYNKPEETAKVIFEKDGKRWLRTGDIGKMVKGPDGRDFLKITDRKKELLKTSGGKYVAPAPIESKLKEDFLIEQVMIVGEQKKFVSAIINPAEDTLKEWCHRHEIPWSNLKDILSHPKVVEKYQHILDKYNPGFNHVEQVKKFVLVPDTWEPVKNDGSDAELTPTLKLKRRVLLKKYEAEIEKIYT
jgi:long-chain acyl-CoA synthetase